MNLLRLTYFQCTSEQTEETKWEYGDTTYELFGTPEAVFMTWFHFKELEETKPLGVHPRFVEVFNMRGEKMDMSQGLNYVRSKAASGFK